MQTTLYLTVTHDAPQNRFEPIEALQHGVWTLVPNHFAGTIKRVSFIAPNAPDESWKAEIVISVDHEAGDDAEAAEDIIVDCAQGDIRAVEENGTVQVTLDEVTTGAAA